MSTLTMSAIRFFRKIASLALALAPWLPVRAELGGAGSLALSRLSHENNHEVRFIFDKYPSKR